MRNIAICLWGQPRTWKQCRESFRTYIEQDNQVTYFVHMWNRNSQGGPTPGDPYVNKSQVKVEEKLPKTILQGCLEFEFGSHVRVEDVNDIPILTKWRQLQSCQLFTYSISSVAGMCCKFMEETKAWFDYIVLSRPDLQFPGMLDWDSVGELNRAIGIVGGLSSADWLVGKDEHLKYIPWVSDQFWICKPRVLWELIDIWPFVYTNFDKAKYPFNEQYVRNFFFSKEINVKALDFDTTILRMTRGTSLIV